MAEKTATAAPSSDRWLKIDPPHETPKPASPTAPTKAPAAVAATTVPKASASIPFSTTANESPAQGKLSKAERKH